MLSGNFKLAWQSVKAAKWRNMLTMFGIIVGVASIISIVSIGAGFKDRVRTQIDATSSNLLVVRPGNIVKRSDDQKVTGIDPLAIITNSTVLSDDDVEAVANTRGISRTTPISKIDGELEHKDQTTTDISVFATNSDMADMLGYKTQFGEFLTDNDEGKNFAVIGKSVAEKFFKQSVPIGLTFKFRGQEFIVKGVFEDAESNSLLFGENFNDSVFIPYTTGKLLTQNRSQLYQVIAEPQPGSNTEIIRRDVEKNLLKSHGNEKDFAVVTQDEMQEIAAITIDSITSLFTTIAILAIIVGGVGIMNVMLVSVSERTPEIGIRKAVGATNSQILWQFMIEAVILSFTGSFVGIAIAMAANGLLRVYTNLDPVVEPSLIVGIFVMAMVAGVIFGVAPAAKAARKKPIEALRNIAR